MARRRRVDDSRVPEREEQPRTLAFPNFQQMARIGSTPEVKLVVEMGRPKNHFSLQFGAWSKTLRFLVEKAQSPPRLMRSAISGRPTWGMRGRWWTSSPGAAKPFLRSAPCWSSGTTVKAGALPSKKGSRFPRRQRRRMGGIATFQTTTTQETSCSTWAIQDALAKELGGESLDVIAFDACLMAMVETAYALRGITQVMVGSGNSSPAMGGITPLAQAARRCARRRRCRPVGSAAGRRHEGGVRRRRRHDAVCDRPRGGWPPWSGRSPASPRVRCRSSAPRCPRFDRRGRHA